MGQSNQNGQYRIQKCGVKRQFEMHPLSLVLLRVISGVFQLKAHTKMQVFCSVSLPFLRFYRKSTVKGGHVVEITEPYT
jgi:hypothetical protein